MASYLQQEDSDTPPPQTGPDKSFELIKNT